MSKRGINKKQTPILTPSKTSITNLHNAQKQRYQIHLKYTCIYTGTIEREGEREREREREREVYRDRDRDREAQRERERQKERDRDRER